MYTKSSYEMEEIEVRIEKAYKKVWMLKSIGSRRIQINFMTFSKDILGSNCVKSMLCSVPN